MCALCHTYEYLHVMCNKKDEVEPAAALTPRLANGSRGGHLVCPGEAAPGRANGVA